MSWLTNRYNKKSAKRYGWHPSWFAAALTEFNDDLTESIKRFQYEHDLSVDGKVGPNTFRRLLAERDLEESDNFILCHGKQVDIDWDVKVDLLPKNCYRTNRSTRKPKMIVTHWDATTSAERCKRVLQARNISSHFCIDNDGVIYQYVDTNHTAWHAGKVNRYSIGIDFTNAYYLKYADWYEKKGFGPRPVCKSSKVHGRRLKPHLGYYPIQIKAYKALLRTLCDHYNINLNTPPEDGVWDAAATGRYNGIVCHYHLTRNKIDCAGLDLQSIVAEL